jgi:hypothetical protein
VGSNVEFRKKKGDSMKDKVVKVVFTRLGDSMVACPLAEDEGGVPTNIKVTAGLSLMSHDNCGGDFHWYNNSRIWRTLFCRKCGLRFSFPATCKTFAQFVAYVDRKLGPRRRPGKK